MWMMSIGRARYGRLLRRRVRRGGGSSSGLTFTVYMDIHSPRDKLLAGSGTFRGRWGEEACELLRAGHARRLLMCLVASLAAGARAEGAGRPPLPSTSPGSARSSAPPGPPHHPSSCCSRLPHRGSVPTASPRGHCARPAVIWILGVCAPPRIVLTESGGLAQNGWRALHVRRFPPVYITLPHPSPAPLTSSLFF